MVVRNELLVKGLLLRKDLAALLLMPTTKIWWARILVFLRSAASKDSFSGVTTCRDISRCGAHSDTYPYGGHKRLYKELCLFGNQKIS